MDERLTVAYWEKRSCPEGPPRWHPAYEVDLPGPHDFGDGQPFMSSRWGKRLPPRCLHCDLTVVTLVAREIQRAEG